jgi:phosphorylcholine metabolism protein LicD
MGVTAWKIVCCVLLAIIVMYILALITLSALRTQKRKNLIQMFCDTVDTFHQHDVKYVLCWGTLLGGIREGKIIQNDDDVDFVIFGKDERARALSILNEKYPNRVNFQENRLLGSGFWKKMHCDFDYANLVNNTWVRDDPMNHLGKMLPDEHVERVQISMHDRKPYVPRNAHKILQELYGDDYMTPIAYKKTDGDWRHNFSKLKMRATLKKIGLFL